MPDSSCLMVAALFFFSPTKMCCGIGEGFLWPMGIFGIAINGIA